MSTLTALATAKGQEPVERPRSLTEDVILGAVVTAALLFAHAAALSSMVDTWNVSPMYSYGFTVPAISAFLLWSRRDALARLTPRPGWMPGAPVVAAGVLLAIAARAVGIHVLDQIAFVVSLAGAVLVLFGTAYVKVAWAALAYLLLMIPVWDGFTEQLHAPFQMRSAEIGIWMLQLVGIPAHREGTFISLPNLVMEVQRACSGVNYLVAVFALGLPLAYLYLHGIWRRVALLVSALLIAALSNGLRVAMIGVLAYYEIGSPLHGPFHVLHGLFVAGIGYVVLFVGLRLLSTRDARARPAPVKSLPQGGRFVSRGAAFALILVFVGVGSNVLARTPQRVTLAGDLTAFPLQLGDWTASSVPVSGRDAATHAWPGADVSLRRRYLRADGARVDVYVGYFASQAAGKQLASYLATDIHNRAEQIPVGAGESGAFEVNFVPATGDTGDTLFWYDLDAGPEASRYAVKARTIWNSMVSGRTNGAVVVLVSREPGGSSGADALRALAPLVRDALARTVSTRRTVADRS
jgi:EpsI family protein